MLYLSCNGDLCVCGCNTSTSTTRFAQRLWFVCTVTVQNYSRLHNSSGETGDFWKTFSSLASSENFSFQFICLFVLMSHFVCKHRLCTLCFSPADESTLNLGSDTFFMYPDKYASAFPPDWGQEAVDGTTKASGIIFSWYFILKSSSSESFWVRTYGFSWRCVIWCPFLRCSLAFVLYSYMCKNKCVPVNKVNRCGLRVTAGQKQANGG